MYGDSGGLWLQVSGKGAKSWIYRFTLGGKARAMGLGSANTFSLAEARDKAWDCRKLTAEDLDPIEIRSARRQDSAVEAARAITFRSCAVSYIEAHRAGWRNIKHSAQWTATLETYGYPAFSDLPVQPVDNPLARWSKTARAGSYGPGAWPAHLLHKCSSACVCRLKNDASLRLRTASAQQANPQTS